MRDRSRHHGLTPFALALTIALSCFSASSFADEPSAAVDLDAALDDGWDLADAALFRDAPAEPAIELLTWVSQQVGDEVASARAAYKLGAVLEHVDRPDEALAAYRLSLSLDPGGRFADRSLARAGVLGEVAPEAMEVYREFARIRRQYLELGSDEATRRVVALREQTPDDAQRTQLALWLANEYLYKRDEIERARLLFLEVAESEDLDALTYFEAFQGAAWASEDLSAATDSRRRLRAFMQARPDVAEAVTLYGVYDQLRDTVQRTYAKAASLISIALLLIAFMLTRAWKSVDRESIREWKPWRSVLFVVYLFLAAGWMAERWEHHNFAAIAACAGPVAIAVLMVGCIARRDIRHARIIAALLGLLSVLSAVYLTLDAFDKQAIMGM